MKTLLLLLGLSLALTTGCVRTYQITLTNGHTITTHGKPKLNKETGAFIYKDPGTGKPASIPGFRVRQIEPL